MSTPNTTVTSAYDTIIQTITTLTGLDVYRQGSLSGNYPTGDFVTIWESYSYGTSKYNNDYKCVRRMFNICVYSKSPNNAFSKADAIYCGITGKSKAVTRDVPTDFSEWYGRGMTLYINDN